MIALLDGEPASSIPVSDSTVIRGDGVFESIRSYQGRLFALEEHLDRLARSAAGVGIVLPPGIEGWCRRVAALGGDGIVRVVVSRGDAIPGCASGPRCLVVHHPVPSDRPQRLVPVTAHWHPAGRPWELSGVKTTSYAPNLAAGREARRRGGDDALLVSEDGVVLEGPTFSLGWIVGNRFETPSLDLGILDSITRRKVLSLVGGLGLESVEGRFPLRRLAQADEVVVLSTANEVNQIVGVGDWTYRRGPMGTALADAFRRLVSETLGVGRVPGSD